MIEDFIVFVHVETFKDGFCTRGYEVGFGFHFEHAIFALGGKQKMEERFVVGRCVFFSCPCINYFIV